MQKRSPQLLLKRLQQLHLQLEDCKDPQEAEEVKEVVWVVNVKVGEEVEAKEKVGVEAKEKEVQEVAEKVE